MTAREVLQAFLDAWPLWSILLLVAAVAYLRIPRRPPRCMCHLLMMKARERGAHCVNCHRSRKCRCREVPS